MINDKKLNIFIKGMDCAIESIQTCLDEYDENLSVEQKRLYKRMIEGYQDTKSNVEYKISNMDIIGYKKDR
ncbi:hypothetical protein [Tepidibacter hydrothermalis]|uniref:Uncharacterized protein n=1 Tax=Tepidibacter hydrothermalis TaxID=3036126 RepID=A0ABY8E8Q6_9FIRM|nr:hypothetical protein [Tepidibacter hydrothermalis]WFD09287.1 hypothetical protein P4S50_12930 [Tepidibacter hydrothermalis]